ncbi:MAG TPA: hypothetical protein VN380_12470 [Thermoanaerobaculia bacterium]|jgi:hypothetical protein|nr:hypothetical protein [Thermoanaerobaculia bacterium]
MKIITVAVALLIATGVAFASPPPLTDAEKAACELVAEYLAHGADAAVQRLSAGSPLGAIPRAEAIEEVRARLGPPGGSAWELRTSSEEFSTHGAVFHVVFPSGVEDLVAFDMTENGGVWKIKEIRTLVDVPPAELKSAPKSESSGTPPTSRNILWFLFAAPLLAIGGAISRRPHPRLSSAALLAALVVFAVPVAETIDPQWTTHVREMGPRSGTRPTAAASYVALAPLRSMRDAIARGEPSTTAGSVSELQREAATLWKTQLDMGRITPEDVHKRMASVRSLTNAPLAILIRARVASNEGRERDAAKEYAALSGRLAPNDAFDLELQAARDLADTNSRTVPVAEPRSRDAGLYYVRSIEQVVAGNLNGARKSFRDGWRLQPISRRGIIEAGIFAFLLRDPTFSILFNVNTPDEQKVADVELARSPMQLPPGSRAMASGQFLQLSIAQGRLDIPGGCDIAPPTAVVVSPTDLEREDTEAALRAVSHFSPASLASASAQRAIEDAADALSQHDRWNDILRLTDGITAKSENMSTPLLMWRIRALLRAHRTEEGRRIATGSAMAAAMRRAPDAGTLIEISALLGAAQAWPEAAEMLQRVSSIKDGPDVGTLLQRLELRRQLATSPAVVTTQHFAVHTTADVPVTVAERIGEILEAELLRVSARLGTSNFTPVRVNVLRWDDFRNQLTFSDQILGFYDGEITIPFGNVSRFRDTVVAILSHEMTHAIVAQATGDNAPRWFQEGVAQRMELVERQENIFQLQRDQQFLAFDLIGPTMTSSIDPLAIGQAYLIAETFIHFLEDRYGPAAVTKMMTEFGAGHDTTEAILAVTGKTIPDIDREFRTWGTTHAEAFIDRTPWPYTAYYSLGIDPVIRQGIHFSRPKP